MDDKRLRGLARQLYERHREAFEFVFESRPEPDDILEPLRELIEVNPIFELDRPSPRRVRFALSEWANQIELNSCPPNKWTRTKRSLLFELQAHRSSPRINISLILGPGEDALRKHIFLEVSKNPALFIDFTKPLGRDTSTIFTRDLLSAVAATGMDEATKQTELQSAWSRFVAHDLTPLNSAIIQILAAYRMQASLPGGAPIK